ncbi:hypothetical protein IGS68_08925 [Skermanella sp. TT6]|uniref:Uncharacterized protein n=1 Tax=Skermanella cutis TaxID=2775420 RepID=A0ABX7BAZ9_9PROT|nr:hypothetical protein [Skermanella sp. TT6]QQP91309.1 hypothetical protein IGS68_08925 [Skermanella sp. TT6]
MIDFDQLVEALQGHLGIAGDAVSDALSSLDGDHLEILARNLDPDEVVRMLEAAGVEANDLPPDQLADVLETLAEAVSEVADETEGRKPASAGREEA